MKSVFKRYKQLLAIIVATGWSMAYPFIKMGYEALGIEGDDLGGKLLFAGVRFFLAGIIVLTVCCLKGSKLQPAKKSNLGWLVLLALVNTTLHYMFSYIGLGYNSSARSTILDSMGGFFMIFLSVLIFADDRLSLRKCLGCLLGLSGIIMINLDFKGGFFDDITFWGDGMILLNALCAAFGGVITRVVSKKMNILSATGYSMSLGGALLVLTGIIAKPKRSWIIGSTGIVILVILILISAVCFAIYNELLSVNPISEIAIFNALIPVLGVFFAALLLGETLKWQYFAAVIVVAVGIWFCNSRKR